MTDAIRDALGRVERWARQWGHPATIYEKARVQLTVLEAEREALREAVISGISNTKMLAQYYPSLYREEAIAWEDLEAALASVSSDMRLVPKDKLREMLRDFEGACGSRNDPRGSQAYCELASLIGEKGDDNRLFDAVVRGGTHTIADEEAAEFRRLNSAGETKG